MKTSGKVLIVIGIIIIIIGYFTTRNLNTVSAVDSHSWTININGINSIQWVLYTGFIIFMVGVCFIIGTLEQRHQRVN
jgi:hypothetical protein